MNKNKRVIVLGLEDDPKGISGTTYGLKKNSVKIEYLQVPTAENSLTVISIGMATEVQTSLSHQRVEFVFTIEQLFNQAAKWNFMSAGKKECL